mmetsp:Transcript_11773/g.16552  ORF Transcript_11773/g.16552 Transcript_11773/m.16552 type:complete len:81 (-) Transcript_11773:670-912(-)
MMCTFGYMDFMIFYKWTINYYVGNEDLTSRAPSIITLLINMPLKLGQPGEKFNHTDTNRTSYDYVDYNLYPPYTVPDGPA